MDCGFRGQATPQPIEERLRQDRDREIRAVLLVHTDTASSVRNDIASIRAAIDAAGHPALLMVDCIASLGCEPYEMDKWGVDVTIAASQKGLMTPAGVCFSFHNARADAARRACPSPYWDWETRLNAEVFYQRFCGTPPTHHLFGLREALDMILNEEGLEACWRRHKIQARAIWAAVAHWRQSGEIGFNIDESDQRSTGVTTIMTARGDADRIRGWCADNGLVLGVGFGALDTDLQGMFRIGHMGHNNPPMILGALATIEAALVALDITHEPGGVSAAAGIFSA